MIKKYFYENIPLSQRSKLPVISAYYCINTNDYPIFHSHEDYWEFTIVEEGILENHTQDAVEIIPSASFFVSTPNDQHCLINPTRGASIRHINITIKTSCIQGILASLSPLSVEKLHERKKAISIPSETLNKITQMLFRCNLIDEREYEKGNTLLFSIIFQLLGILLDKSTKSPKQPTNFSKKLNSLMSAPESITYTVADLCQILNYSRAQLNRYFHKEFNLTPHKFLIAHKLAYAKNLLIFSDMTVVTIAQKLGYVNLAQFNTIFKENFGITPGKYRILIKSQNDIESNNEGNNPTISQ
ncbi:MAG: helix-turn-helix transcriptional regulator [Clostridia bacterium]|nr:helix-turn-helix transcriptional regulator [Clostridia bacterium]